LRLGTVLGVSTALRSGTAFGVGTALGGATALGVEEAALGVGAALGVEADFAGDAFDAAGVALGVGEALDVGGVALGVAAALGVVLGLLFLDFGVVSFAGSLGSFCCCCARALDGGMLLSRSPTGLTGSHRLMLFDRKGQNPIILKSHNRSVISLPEERIS
jgi:hypothetical protein